MASTLASHRSGRDAAGRGEVEPPVDLAKGPPRAEVDRARPDVREDEDGVVGRKQIVHSEAGLGAREGGLGALEPPQEPHRVNAVVLDPEEPPEDARAPFALRRPDALGGTRVPESVSDPDPGHARASRGVLEVRELLGIEAERWQEPPVLVEDVRGLPDHPARGEPLLEGRDQPTVLRLGQLRRASTGVETKAVEERVDRFGTTREAPHERVDTARERLADGRAEESDPRPPNDERAADRLLDEKGVEAPEPADMLPVGDRAREAPGGVVPVDGVQEDGEEPGEGGGAE